MIRLVLILLVLFAGCYPSDSEKETAVINDTPSESLYTEKFSFEVGGQELVGLLDSPAHGDPTATIIIVHGYGRTNVVEQNWFYGLRSHFASIGINTLMWDKPGCGESEGEFDINQPVQSSAQEVIKAVSALQERQIAGSERIGIWGISRAGWIAPLAMQQEPAIDFWISVSGTDDKENARYLIESNLLIEGRSESETEQLVAEWQAQFNTLWKNGTYQQYLEASPNLNQDEFIKLMGWDGTMSEEDFLAYQNKFIDGEIAVDEEDELMIYVPGFRDLLASIDRPVLALFGEKDTNVDWRKTSALYQETIGTNPKASLTVRVFPDANHVLKVSQTGGVREMQEQPWDTPYADGYYESMLTWLVEQGFGAE